jgi:outer membrane protein W
MVKRGFVVFLAALAVSSVASAGSFSLFGFGWDQSDVGTVGGGGLRMTSGDGGWLIDLTLSYATQHYSVEALNYQGRFKVLPVDLGVRYTSPYPHLVRPYAGGGITYSFINVTTGKANNKWGVYGVAGLYIGNIRTVDFFVEAMYRAMNETKITFRGDGWEVPVHVDASGWQGSLGVTFHF